MENMINIGLTSSVVTSDSTGLAPRALRFRAEHAGFDAGTDEYCPPGPPVSSR